MGREREKKTSEKKKVKTVGEKMLYNQGAGWGTHKELGCQKHHVSHRVFLVDNVIVAKAMHSKVKYERVSIFVISKNGQ